MQLADFIAGHIEPIALQLDGVLAPQGADQHNLHSHIRQLLQNIADDLAGAAPISARPMHDGGAMTDGSSIDALLAAYGRLRTGVMQMWMDSGHILSNNDANDVLRFHQVIDLALAQTVQQYTALVNHSQHLFLAILGHDLRNPLNTTIVAASMLMGAPDIKPGHASVAAQIERSGKRMSALVDDLIDYTRTRLGSPLPMALASCDMARICHAIADECRQAHPERDLVCQSEPALYGLWDEGRLAQALSNLVGNALQHGDSMAAITMRAHAAGSDVLVDIHNWGEAIAPASLRVIFDPMVRFSEAAGQTPARKNSLGMGLYIARAIAEAHGGSISVRSSTDDGTCFRLRLPRQRCG